MAPTRARSLSIRPSTVVALLLVLVTSARGFPLSGRALDSAVDGVQRYLESSGFPKMTRGEVLDFLDEFSRSSRVSRSEKGAGADTGAKVVDAPALQSSGLATPRRAAAETGPKIPDGESPLNYGYPMSVQQERRSTSERPPAEPTTSMIFVTVPVTGNPTAADVNGEKTTTTTTTRRPVVAAAKKSTVPAVDPNAYVKFKKIPEAKNLKIDDDMKDFLDGFGLLDPPRSAERPAAATVGNARSQRRNDGDAESADERLLKSVLAETGAANASQIEPLIASISKSEHVFNPTGAAVKTVDVNRIAKIVENIRLLTDDNGTVALPPELVQQRFENITAAISAIDRPAAADGGQADGFNGYEVFFDDSSKEVDSDLPADSPAAAAGVAGTGGESLAGTLHQQPPDPLSTEELQRLSEKNDKSDVKRQQPAAETTEDPVAVSTSSEAVQATATATELLEATSFAAAASDAPPAAGQPKGPGATEATEASPSLSQLAESFGGGETASEAPPAAVDSSAAVPANRPKNGLYFYVDWNSFLTVNNGQRNQVNLKFAPKAGNPAHFLRVTVP